MKFGKSQIIVISVIGVVLALLGFGFVGYKMAEAVVEENDKIIIQKSSSANSMLSFLCLSILYQSDIFNVLFLEPTITDKKEEIKFFIKCLVSPVSFQDAKSDKEKAKVLIEYFEKNKLNSAKYYYSHMKVYLNKEPEATKDMKSSFMVRFFTRLGFFRNSLYYKDMKTYQLLKKYWDLKEKTRVLFSIPEDYSIIIVIYNKEEKKNNEIMVLSLPYPEIKLENAEIKNILEEGDEMQKKKVRAILMNLFLICRHFYYEPNIPDPSI